MVYVGYYSDKLVASKKIYILSEHFETVSLKDLNVTVRKKAL